MLTHYIYFQIQKDFPASFMLQSIHEKASRAQIQTPKPLPIINQTRKRNRKPDKSAICHVVPEVIIQEEEIGNFIAFKNWSRFFFFFIVFSKKGLPKYLGATYSVLLWDLEMAFCAARL